MLVTIEKVNCELMFSGLIQWSFVTSFIARALRQSASAKVFQPTGPFAWRYLENYEVS
jgi:hypothetical protein